MKVGSTGMKWLRVIHIMAAGVWFGSTIAILVLLSACLSPFDPELYAILAPLAQQIFQYTIGTAAIIIIIEAFVYGCVTHWGFFKHTWVTLKWILLVLLCLSIGIGFFGQLFGLTSKINTPGYIPASGDGNMLMLYTVLQVVVIMVMIIISVLKPWPKKAKQENAISE